MFAQAFSRVNFTVNFYKSVPAVISLRRLWLRGHENIMYWYFCINTSAAFHIICKTSRLCPIDCTHFPTDTYTWTCTSVSLSIRRIRLHPLTLNSPERGLDLPVCLTTRLPPPMLCKFWPQFIFNCVLPSLLPLRYRLYRTDGCELLQVADNQLSFQPGQMVTVKRNPYLSRSASVNQGHRRATRSRSDICSFSQELIRGGDILTGDRSSRAEIWAIHDAVHDIYCFVKQTCSNVLPFSCFTFVHSVLKSI